MSQVFGLEKEVFHFPVLSDNYFINPRINLIHKEHLSLMLKLEKLVKATLAVNTYIKLIMAEPFKPRWTPITM